MESKSIQLWVHEVHQTAREKGWWDDDGDRSFGDLITLVHSELSETFEEYRNNRGMTEVYFNENKPDKPEGIPVELADAIIRIFDICGHYGIDIERVIEQKHNYNKTRPHRHGGKKV